MRSGSSQKRPQLRRHRHPQFFSWAGNPAAAIEAAQQLWYVCQTTTDRRGEIAAVEQRYFVTSIPTGTLTRDHELALVRMHWAIENGCHWTMDVMLGEDEGHPCQASRASIETVSWLRLIGYNAVSAWRTLAPRKDGKPVAWARAMETLRDALLAAEVTDHRELASCGVLYVMAFDSDGRQAARRIPGKGGQPRRRGAVRAKEASRVPPRASFLAVEGRGLEKVGTGVQ